MTEKANKLVIFEDFLKGLSKTCESENDLVVLFNQALELYRDDWRHSYSFVTKTILKQLDSMPNKGVLSLNDTLLTIFQNLDMIKDMIRRLFIKHDDDVSDDELHILEKSILKLADHIELEFVRLDYIQKNHKTINDGTAKLNLKFSELYTSYFQVNSDLMETKSNLQKINEDFKNQKVEAITVLGVFVGIVAVIAANIGLSTSILANMAKIATPKQFLFLFITAFFNISTLGALFLFLLSFNGRKLGYGTVAVAVGLSLASVCLIILTLVRPDLFTDFSNSVSYQGKYWGS